MRFKSSYKVYGPERLQRQIPRAWAQQQEAFVTRACQLCTWSFDLLI